MRWKEAIDAEIRTLIKADTWELVPRPADANVIGSKFVLRIKLKAGGAIDKFKARLVAQGFTQVEGVDYFLTFAPVAKLASLRIILAIAARNDWDVQVFDFHAAFLNGEFDDNEELYMEQPPDHEFANRRDYVLRLRKTIYGLKQSSRKWYEKLTASLATLGFAPLATDYAVFRLISGADIIILAIHVDDCTITGSSPLLIDSIQTRIGELFQITRLGDISWLLGMEITRDRARRTLSINQTSYIDSLMQRFGMENAKPTAVPRTLPREAAAHTVYTQTIYGNSSVYSCFDFVTL